MTICEYLTGDERRIAYTMKRLEVKPGFLLIYDAEDEAVALSRRWHVSGSYVVHKPFGRKRAFFHNLVMHTPDGYVVDHINGDKLDCRKQNLRICFSAENARNRKLNKNNTSGFKGVSRVSKNRWRASLRINGSDIRGSLYSDPAMAAKEYDLMSRAWHGEFGRVNADLAADGK
jgi:hypothetical protein